MALNIARIFCIGFCGLVSLLLLFGLILFAFDLNMTSISYGLSNKEFINIVNLESSRGSDEKPVLNSTERIEFTGKYEMIESKNFDKFLEELGVGFLQRTVASKASAEYEITADNGVYTLRTISPFRSTEISFKLNGEEFEESRLDGERVRSSVVQNGNKWIHKQLDNSNNTVTIVREFSADTIRVTGAFNNVGFVRVYKKIE